MGRKWQEKLADNVYLKIYQRIATLLLVPLIMFVLHHYDAEFEKVKTAQENTKLAVASLTNEVSGKSGAYDQHFKDLDDRTKTLEQHVYSEPYGHTQHLDLRR